MNTKQNTKEISIIIPVYNCEEFLKDCFESIEEQTISRDKIEVIIVNDGSTDNSLRIIQQYCKKNKNWLLVDQKNQGLSESRNNGLKYSTAKYIFFLDSDDTLPNNAIEVLYNKAIKSNSDIVIGKMINYNSTNQYDYYTAKWIKNIDNIYYPKDKYILNFISACGKLYKKNILKNTKFIPNLKHEDNYFSLSLILKHSKISMITDNVYNRRIREGENKSITQKLNIKSLNDLLANYKKVLKENNADYYLKKHLILKSVKYIVKYIPKEEINDSKKLINNFIKLNIIDNSEKIEKICLTIYHRVLLIILKVLVILKRR